MTQTGASERPASAARRAELIAAAQRVAGRQGFDRATVDAITREAGVSLGLLNYHFASKDDLLAQAFADVARRDLSDLEAIARRDEPAPVRLGAFLDASGWSDRDSWRLWVDGWGSAVWQEPLRTTLERFAHGWRTSLATVLADGARDGDWSCPDPADAAGRLVAALDGIGVHATLHPADVPPERAASWARRLVEAELGVALPLPAGAA